MVYLIHFYTPLHHAQHYIGFVASRSNKALENRYHQHLSGVGAKILRACNQQGISYDIVRIWRKEGRSFERQLKNRKKARLFCPCCNQRIK